MSLLSKVTPRVLILSVIWTVVPATLNRSVWRQCTATLMNAQPDSLWLIRVQVFIQTINTEPLMQCTKIDIRSILRPIESYWPWGGEWNEKLCVISILLVVLFQMSWWDDPQERWKPKKGLGSNTWTLRDTSAQRGSQSILIDQPRTLWTPCRLSIERGPIDHAGLKIPVPRLESGQEYVVTQLGVQTQRSGQVIQGLLAD